MLIISLKDLMVKKGALIGKRLSYADIQKETGITISKLSKIANDQTYNINRKDIEKLCLYFNCTPNDLMTIVPEPGEGEEKKDG